MRNYYSAQVCFECRKSFKRTYSEQPKCLFCGNEAHIMGRNFKVPATTDEKQWRKIKILLQCGFDVGGSSSHRVSLGIDKYPETLDQVEDFIHHNWQKRCKDCMGKLAKEYGFCPKNRDEINAFIDLWLKK